MTTVTGEVGRTDGGEAAITLEMVDQALAQMRVDPREAQSLLEAVLDREPNHVFALERLAGLDPDTALERLTEADRRDSLSSLAAYGLWFELLAPTSTLRARRVALRASEKFAGSVDSQLIVTSWLARLGDADQAWRALSAVSPSLTDEQLRLMLAVVRAMLATADEDWPHRADATELVIERLGYLGRNREDQTRIEVAALLSDEGHHARAEDVLAQVDPQLATSREALAVQVKIDASKQDWAAVHRSTAQIRASGHHLSWVEEIYLAVADAESGKLNPALRALEKLLESADQAGSEPAEVRAAREALCHVVRHSAAYNSGGFDTAWRSVIAVRRILTNGPTATMRPDLLRELEVFVLAGVREPVGELPPPAGWATPEDHDYEVSRLGALVLWGANDPGRIRVAEDAVRCALVEIQQQRPEPKPGDAQGTEEDRRVGYALDLAYVYLLAEMDAHAWDQLESVEEAVLRTRDRRSRSGSAVRNRVANPMLDANDLRVLSFLSLRAHAALRTHRAEVALDDVEHLLRMRPHMLEYRILRVHALFACHRYSDADAAADELCLRFPNYAPAQLWRAEILTHHVSSNSGTVPLERLNEAVAIYSRVIEGDQRRKRFLDADGETDGKDLGSDPLSPRLIAHAAQRGLHAAIKSERVSVKQRLPRDREFERQAGVLVDALTHVDDGAHAAEARRLERLLHRPRRRARSMRWYKAGLPILLIGLVFALFLSGRWDDTVGGVPSDIRLWLAVVIAVLLAWPYVKGMTFSGFSFEKVDPELDLGESDAHVLAGVASGASVLRARAMRPPSTVPASTKPAQPHEAEPDPVGDPRQPNSPKEGENVLSIQHRSEPPGGASPGR
jgi:tetratricopeptide (TPR) repeat protein